MKSYNIANYIRWKKDIELKISKLPEVTDGDFTIYNREQMIICFAPLVENLSRKFSTTQQASGVMTIMDLIQEGNSGLTKAVDRLDYSMLDESEDQEKTLKSFFSKRIKGQIRRNFGKDKKMVSMFFNSIFLSIDDKPNQDDDSAYQIPDKSEPYNMQLLNTYLKGLMRKYLNNKEYEVLRLSYGLDCDKYSAKQIAAELKIEGSSSYVRVSQLKKQAVTKLIDNVDHSQVLDYL